MKKTLFYLFLSFLSALSIYGLAFSEDRQIRHDFMEQDISEIGYFAPMEENGSNVTVSRRYNSLYLLSTDLGSLKKEVELELLYQNANENPTSPNFVAVFRLVLNELTCLRRFKSLLESVELEVDRYRRKYKLKGEIGLAEQDCSTKPKTCDKNSENSLLNLLPKKLSWNVSSDLNSTYLKGEVNLGKYFLIEANWGSDSDVRALVTFPL